MKIVGIFLTLFGYLLIYDGLSRLLPHDQYGYNTVIGLLGLNTGDASKDKQTWDTVYSLFGVQVTQEFKGGSNSSSNSNPTLQSNNNKSPSPLLA